jgi:hypothetical protein
MKYEHRSNIIPKEENSFTTINTLSISGEKHKKCAISASKKAQRHFRKLSTTKFNANRS